MPTVGKVTGLLIRYPKPNTHPINDVGVGRYTGLPLQKRCKGRGEPMGSPNFGVLPWVI
jgi:hypothetical protein